MAVRDEQRASGELHLPRRQALLALLASEGASGLSAERVRSLLPSDEEPGAEAEEWISDARALVAALGEEQVVVTDDVIYLQPYATTDVAEFRAAIAAGELTKAVQLYEGRFVDGFHYATAPEFERWLQIRRESLASEADAALEQLAEAATARGEPLMAVRWWRLLAAHHPLNHRIAASLMEALVAAGDREGAIRHARFHEALLAEQLDRPGEDQVLEMARSLRAGRSTLPAPGTGQGREAAELAPGPREAGGADALSRFRAAVSDRYEIEREIARGGHGIVLLAGDVRHQRAVAIKVLHAELAGSSIAERFQREIRLVAALQHPNILPLFDSGMAAGIAFYVMPYVRGESLRSRLRRETAIAVDEALAVALQAAAGLQEAHRCGIVHRDVKPENLLLSGGQAMVADFGIACVLDSTTDNGLTAPGFVVGTPAYMSPEQAVPGERAIDARSDQYSLACVLYEMLTGQPPFGGSAGRAVLARHVSEDPLPPRKVRSELPQLLDSTLLRALAKSPEDRFRSMAEFSGALLEAVEARPRGWRAATAFLSLASIREKILIPKLD